MLQQERMKQDEVVTCQEYSTEPFCQITVLQGHHELAGNLSTGIEILLVICYYRKLAGSVFTKLFYGWKKLTLLVGVTNCCYYSWQNVRMSRGVI